MNKYIMRLIVMILIAGISCKKENRDYVPSKEKKWMVATVAGDGTNSFADGAALSAKFNGPVDVVAMADGSLYVTDSHNSRIRKIKEGLVSTFAGNDISGITNGNGASAQFMYPYSITAGAGNNLFISDYTDSRIRRISPSADVTTYAGSGLPSFEDGPAASASFFLAIEGIAADAKGDIYVADTYNMRIRKISTAGEVITIAGSDTAGSRNGQGSAAQFYYPSGIASDKQGNLFVTEPYAFRIRKITPEGLVTTFAGNGEFGYVDGDNAAARFRFPLDIVIDSQENLYVLDDSRVRKISSQGIVSTIAGSVRGYEDGDGTLAKFNSPTGLGIDAHDNIYVADFANNLIRKLSFE